MFSLAPMPATASVPLPPIPTFRIKPNIASRNFKKTYIVQRALDPATRRDAFALRHRSYLASNYIEPREDGLFSDGFDSLPSAHTAVVYQDGRAVAAVRVCFLSSDTLNTAPAGVTFPDEVAALLAPLPRYPGKAQACEITRLVRSPAAENNQGLVFLLLRLAGYMGLQENVSLIMSCVRQNHVPFYRRLGLIPAGDLRPYPGLSCPMQLLAYPRENYDNARQRFPIMDPCKAPADDFHDFMAGRPTTMTLMHGD